MTAKKKTTKSKPKAKQGYWDHFIQKPKHKPTHHPKRKAKAMSTTDETETQAPAPAETEEQPEVLPPPDPPKVKSEPQEPAAFDEIDESEKGADPEDRAAEFELDIIPESVYPRGVGPEPEPPEGPEVDPGEEEP